VELCTIAGGGHTWPSGGLDGLSPLLVGSESQTLPISDVIWEFLAGQRLRP
jgi:poly(3-hydroxybutyrate) depolymerase